MFLDKSKFTMENWARQLGARERQPLESVMSVPNTVAPDMRYEASNYRSRPYFLRTFAITWAFWGVGAWLSFRPGGQKIYMVLMFAGLVTPFAVSWFMLRRREGSGSKRDFVRRLIRPDLIKPRMLPALLFLMPASVLAATALSLLVGEPASQFHLAHGFSFHTGFVPVLLTLLLAALFEELGWRGYGFESLRRGRNLLSASLVFGLLWSLWHLPLVLANGSYQYEVFQQSVWFGLNFFIGIVPLGVIVSWIYVKNSNSVLAAVVFHFLTNISQEALQLNPATKCIQTGVLILITVGIVVYDKKLFLGDERLE